MDMCGSYKMLRKGSGIMKYVFYVKQQMSVLDMLTPDKKLDTQNLIFNHLVGAKCLNWMCSIAWQILLRKSRTLGYVFRELRAVNN